MAWKCLQLCRTHCLHNCFFSAVNYRGFPRQLTAAGLGNLRQLTAEGQFRLLHVFLFLAFSNVWTAIFHCFLHSTSEKIIKSYECKDIYLISRDDIRSYHSKYKFLHIGLVQFSMMDRCPFKPPSVSVSKFQWLGGYYRTPKGQKKCVDQ